MLSKILEEISYFVADLIDGGVFGIVILLMLALLVLLFLRLLIGGFLYLLRGGYYRRRMENSEAAYQVGLKYKNSGMMQRAIAPLTESARMGHPLAQYHLGDLYYHGSGNGGDDGGQYRDSEFLARDPVLGTEYLKKSAMQGVARAQDALSQIYLKGEGAVIDPARGYIWALVARASGVAAARDRVLRYEAELLKDYSAGHLKSWQGEAVQLFNKIQARVNRLSR